MPYMPREVMLNQTNCVVWAEGLPKNSERLSIVPTCSGIPSARRSRELTSLLTRLCPGAVVPQRSRKANFQLARRA